MKKSYLFLSMVSALMALMVSTIPQRASASPRWHGDMRGGGYHGHDFNTWRGGGWHNGWHDHRFGWWWVVGGLYYPYPAAIYPYPDPYQPPVTVNVVQPQPVAPPPPVVQAQPNVWYYCDRPAGYYPYVPNCQSGWRTVPASPPVGGAPY